MMSAPEQVDTTVRTKQDVMTDADYQAWHERWKRSVRSRPVHDTEPTRAEVDAQELASFDAAEAGAINRGFS